MSDLNSDERPQKRPRLENDQDSVPATKLADTFVTDDEIAKELQVGITTYVDPSKSVFRGVLKKRYTDFLVNEILPDGTVLHLRNTTVARSGGGAPSSTTESSSTVQANSHDESSQGPAKSDAASAQNEKPIEQESRTDEAPVQGEKPIERDSQSNEVVKNAVQEIKQEVTEDDRAKLVNYFNEEAVVELMSLYESIVQSPDKKPKDHPTVRTEFTSDRSVRSQIHQDIRRIFNRKIDSSTDKDGILVLTAAAATTNRGRDGRQSNQKKDGRPGKLGWLDRGGEYVHFTLYKENKDTLEVISFMTKQLRTTNKTFQFAGTKDRRAVTVQRVSAYRVDADRLSSLNRSLRYSAVGDFQYQKEGLELGDLSGNEFIITLRDCSVIGSDAGSAEEQASAAQAQLSHALRQLREKGFLNYYGLQRFGTFAQRTDVVGVKILQGDFKGACEAILDFSPTALQGPESLPAGVLVGQDDRARALGIDSWQRTGKVGAALDSIPRKFSAETALIRHLGRNSKDYMGALLSIQRNLRLMYVHAYQSLIWNLAVGERWKLFGGNVVGGDLVLVHEHKDKQAPTEPEQSVDADGEVIIQPSGEDRASDPNDVFERAKPLTAEEAASGKYTIFDVVLPLPGFDVVYPANASGEWYKTFMASEAGGALDPHNMRRKQRDFSLSGSYRKIMARIGEEFDVKVHQYADDDAQFVETDMDRLKSNNAANGENRATGEAVVKNDKGEVGNGDGDSRPTKLASVLKFQLGSSQYATIALRELSKGGVQAYKAEFTGGR
ncbi:multisubstrate pseudouridine synthase 7 [Knufia peltigerae]|uniref:Multisubstrate pseudouridine synthase 7 n=1 Tax=Knufia peltigerae TaxID=1002370 RepID=A0AA38XJU7_9EURO|nr:multisubstrate pseudouridine synthase 7 [Knufia peltigerae]